MEVVRQTIDSRGFSEDYIHNILYHSEIRKNDRGIVEFYISLRKAYHGESIFEYLFLLGEFNGENKIIPANYYVARILRKPINIKNMKVRVLSDGSVELSAERYLLFCLIMVFKLRSIGIFNEDRSLLEVLNDDDVMTTISEMIIKL